MQKKGITPIIAIVLLLMMVVSAGGLAYVWITQVQTKAQAAVSEKAEETFAKIGQSYQIIAATSSGGGANTDLTIKNTGRKTASALTEVTIKIDEAVTGTFSGCSSTLSPGATCTATLTGVSFPAVGNSISIQLILADGSSVSYGCSVSTTDVC